MKEEGKWLFISLLPVAGIKQEWDKWTELLRKGRLHSSSETYGCWQPGGWCESWIPVDAYGGGNSHCIDMKPGEKGTVGQILIRHVELGPYLKFTDYAAYLEDVAIKMEAGKFEMQGGYFEEPEDEEDL